MKPRLLDLFCGAGGAGMGYHRAGFDVVGIDLHPQPNYPFPFLQADALQALDAGFWRSFDAIHASPPCQRFSALNRAVGNQDTHDDLLTPTRELLLETGLLYVIENVEGARRIMREPAMICGASVGLEVVRHRLFETNWTLFVPPCSHKPGGATDGTYVMFGGRSPRDPGRRVPVRASEREWRDAAGLEFMPIRDARQAIPPAYTELIGHQLRLALRGPGADTAEAAA